MEPKVEANDAFPVTFPAGLSSGGHRVRACFVLADLADALAAPVATAASLALADFLAEAGDEITVLSVGEDGMPNSIARTIPRMGLGAASRIVWKQLPPRACGIPIRNFASVARSNDVFQWLLGHPFDVVHFQDAKGLGFHSIVAKHQGLAFAETLFCVHAQSPTLMCLSADGEYVTHQQHLTADYLESESVRLADRLVSPTRFLLQWMAESGWVLPANRDVLPPLSRRVGDGVRADDSLAKGPAVEFVFAGRLSIGNGLLLFCNALDRIRNDDALRSMVVRFLGTAAKVGNQSAGDYIRERAQQWPWDVGISTDATRTQIVDYLTGPSRVAVLTSIQGPLPEFLPDCLDARGAFIASAGAGIDELIAAEDRAGVLFAPTADALADKLRGVVSCGLKAARPSVASVENRQAWRAWHVALTTAGGVLPMAPAHGADDERPLVSICIAHHNRPEYLRQALASVVAQDYPNIEVVLVDDASTDHAAIELLESLRAGFGERGWQLIRNDTNRYAGASRNIAAKAARGAFLKFLDDDNFSKPGEVSTFVRVARKTGADIVSCALDFFGETTPPNANQMPLFRFFFLGPAVSLGAFQNAFGDTNALFRREVFLKLGGFMEDRHGHGHEDWRLIADAVLQGYRLEAIPDALVWYRRTAAGDNLSAQHPIAFKHSQSIKPYLAALPPSFRGMVLFAQGMTQTSNRPSVVDIQNYISQTVLWCSKLEAGAALVALGQKQAGIGLMVESVKAVEGGKNPRVILDALLGVAKPLSLLDPIRARSFLETAVDLATSLQLPGEATTANRMLAALHPSPPAAMAAAHH